ncbi:prolyl oligopeptidase family serine peptidase [Cognataquiflexum rubidum]|uniref:prolyl oligopeptidase family serine peptidase n=1 Tax=Cognataquiflexum rubidum TaxID=2922273 RepID=UPI001F13082C|nr:prolyl oligopeptidase family serine peptidase [Cognataquiflexum rubidum]MCH6235669.1 prolyl oligopeptidase family serine peptidase [Cognataquiflexum rubidum]
MKNHLIFSMLFFSVCFSAISQEDPYKWLEEVEGDRALEFVKKQNKITEERLSGQKEYHDIFNKSLEIYNSPDRIIYPTINGDFIYNFWQDKDHVRGIWRRASKQSYISGNPDWEVLLDLDKMSEEDKIQWVYKGASGLHPTYDLFLVNLSKGGGDAVVIREFDVTKKAFVDDGFLIEESKGGADFIDRNTLIVATEFGENSMTTSGYPRQVRMWKRGTPLQDAKLIYEAEETDLGSFGGQIRDGSESYTLITKAITIFSYHTYLWLNNKLVKLDIPEDASISGLLNNQAVLNLKSDWNVNGKTYAQGTLVSLDLKELINGQKKIQVIFEPDEQTSVQGVSSTKSKLLVNLLTNVKSELYIYSFDNGKWASEKVDAPDFGTIGLAASDELSDEYYFTFTNFLTPTTLFIANAGDNTFEAFKSLPAYFDGSKYQVQQFQAKSKDGTMVPYFVVSSKSTKLDGKNPTLLYAYGGFEVSQVPNYSATTGTAWLENGGVYVLANIRGGGEFGPKWHQAGLKEKRQNVYDDFHAVAEDLISRKITSNKNLAIYGGSNGGLLVGVAFTQRPDLYQAVVCAVPLLDMQRYNQLLAGASWMGEYGDPDKPEEWAFIKKYSPYHNLKEGVAYPEVYFFTSTKDDRVHPGHARKMAAKMMDMGYPVLYYENMEGGHAGSSTNEQRAKSTALMFSYLLMKLR